MLMASGLFFVLASPSTGGGSRLFQISLLELGATEQRLLEASVLLVEEEAQRSCSDIVVGAVVVGARVDNNSARRGCRADFCCWT